MVPVSLKNRLLTSGGTRLAPLRTEGDTEESQCIDTAVGRRLLTSGSTRLALSERAPLTPSERPLAGPGGPSVGSGTGCRGPRRRAAAPCPRKFYFCCYGLNIRCSLDPHAETPKRGRRTRRGHAATCADPGVAPLRDLFVLIDFLHLAMRQLRTWRLRQNSPIRSRGVPRRQSERKKETAWPHRRSIAHRAKQRVSSSSRP